jgi:hypothetical protein
MKLETRSLNLFQIVKRSYSLSEEDPLTLTAELSESDAVSRPGDDVDRLRQVFYQLGTETEQDRRVGSPVGSPSKGCCSGGWSNP